MNIDDNNLAGTLETRCSELPVRIICELDLEQWHSRPSYQHDWPPSAVFCESAESDSPHLPDWAQLHSCAGMPTARSAVCSLQYCWDNLSHTDIFTNMLSEHAALWHCPAHVQAVCLSGHSQALMFHACDVIVLTPNTGIPRLGMGVYLARLSWHHVSSTAHLHEHLVVHECHVC